MSPFLALLLGLVGILVGAELVVREGSALARRLGISPLVVGMTIVSLGTSLPELAIGINAAQQGNAGLAVGNIVGTNLVNILLILGLSALIAPIAFETRTVRFDLPAMTAAALLLFVLARDGSLSTADGVRLCVFGGSYLLLVLALARHGRSEASAGVVPPVEVTGSRHAGEASGRPVDASPDGSAGTAAVVGPAGPEGRSAVAQLAMLVAGLVLIVAASDVLVDGAVDIARDLGATDAIIGLTIVAVGTSAPELVTTLVSTVRGDRAIAVGNLLGSSVFNIALILGPTIVVAPGAVPVPDDVLALDLLLMVATAVVCVPAFLSRQRLSRVEGGVFVAAYVGYMSWLLATRL